MEEYAVLQDHKLALDYREGQRVNQPLHHKFISDAEELEYWCKYFGFKQPELEPESDEPF